MAELPWFPYDVVEWEQCVREFGLSLEAEGALMRFCRGAWVSDPPCTIVDDREELSRVVGPDWKRGRELVAEIFTPDPANPGRLVSVWLRGIFDRQLAKHQSYVNRGKAGAAKGGRPREIGPDADTVCPECSGPMWDNRARKRSAREPDFRCKAGPRRRGEPGCPGVIWPADSTGPQLVQPSANDGPQLVQPSALSRGEQEQSCSEELETAAAPASSQNAARFSTSELNGVGVVTGADHDRNEEFRVRYPDQAKLIHRDVSRMRRHQMDSAEVAGLLDQITKRYRLVHTNGAGSGAGRAS